MNIKIEELVNCLLRYHSRLADYYFTEKEYFHDPKAVELLDFLKRSEESQENYTERLKNHAESCFNGGTVTLTSETEDILLELRVVKDDRKLEDFDDIVKYGLKNSCNLMKLCKAITDSTDNRDIEIIFLTLYRMANREIANLYTYTHIFG